MKCPLSAIEGEAWSRIITVEEANKFLKRTYINEFNRRLAVRPADPDATAFAACRRSDLDLVFSIQTKRTFNKDNTVSFKTMTLQIDKQSWRGSLAGCQVIVHQHLDRTISLAFG